jgi:hypothetical protein
MTPAGALMMHWVMAVVWILCTPNTSAGYGFVIGLFIYGQLVVGGKRTDLFLGTSCANKTSSLCWVRLLFYQTKL